MRAALACLVLAAGAAQAADWAKPHPHKGVLKPFAADPPPLVLSDKERARLADGKPVFRQVEDQGGTSGRGSAVFRVDAPADVVWGVVLDFPSYPKWIDDLKETKVYGKSGPADGTQTIDVYMRAGKMGVSVEYFVRHVFRNDRRVATWTLDYGKESDLDDSVGFWRVTPLPDDPRKSLVEYAVDLRVKGWVPSFIKDVLLDQGLKQATRWVKVQAEARAPKP